jgi:hypothetical protein
MLSRIVFFVFGAIRSLHFWRRSLRLSIRGAVARCGWLSRFFALKKKMCNCLGRRFIRMEALDGQSGDWRAQGAPRFSGGESLGVGLMFVQSDGVNFDVDVAVVFFLAVHG